MKVLVVEDSPVYRRMIADHLRSWSFEGEIVVDAENAMAVLDRPDAPRLVLLDWVLPKMDALGIVDSLKKLRADEQLMSQLSAGAVTFCQEHFSWSRNATTLEKFYEQIRLTQPKKTHVNSPTVP